MENRISKRTIAVMLSICILLVPFNVNATVLMYGMSSSEVLTLQQNLKELGYFNVEPTGFFGEITEASLLAFQRANGLDADGMAGVNTLDKISQMIGNSIMQPTSPAIISGNNNGTSMLKLGMSGEMVRIYQAKLKFLGLFDTNPTGYYGVVTEDSVKRFQSGFGLTTDGVIGERTAFLINNIVDKLLDDLFLLGDLRKDKTGRSVELVQKALMSLGYYNFEVTGFYGEITENAVVKFQADYGLRLDGVAGKDTLEMIKKVMISEGVVEKANTYIKELNMRWYGGVENLFKIGDTARIFDVGTGKSFYIQRTYGYNHADVETLTAQDTAIMRQIYGGTWSWDRRPVLVYVHGYVIAASMAGMPHAGRDDMPANQWVSNRSGGYGTGSNLDTIKGNNMDGHFDLHFTLSRTHSSNSVCPRHQDAIRQAVNYANKMF